MSKDFDDIVPKRTDGKTTPLPRLTRPLKNTISFQETVRGVREALRGTDAGDDFEKELTKRKIVVK